MPAAYDTYNYPSYWEGREYEHRSELVALKTLIDQIPSLKTIIDIGSGYGRLTPFYIHRAEKVFLIDPSSKLLKLAKQKNVSKKIVFIQSKLENLKGKIRKNTADLIILVRVIHHLTDMDKALSAISGISKKNSYFILEFPNKRHIKEIFLQLLKGNITFLLDIFPKDLRSKSSVKKGDLPFVNYHPDFIKYKLSSYGFRIIKSLSVSNFRYFLFKNHLPIEFVLFLEKISQSFLGKINFGPSIFILAKKVK